MKNIRVFVSENFQFLEVKFFIYLNRRVFVMNNHFLINICAFIFNFFTYRDTASEKKSIIMLTTFYFMPRVFQSRVVQ